MWIVTLKINRSKPLIQSLRLRSETCAPGLCFLKVAAYISVTGHLLFFWSQSSPFVKWKGRKKDQMISKVFSSLKSHVFNESLNESRP